MPDDHHSAEAFHLTDDGRVDINLASVIGSKLQRSETRASQAARRQSQSYLGLAPAYTISEPSLKLNIVIQVVGSRGDVQPFVAIGQKLKSRGHRVRLATHDVFAKFVVEAGLEFFPVGGDPASLMEFMVQNPSLIPSFQSMMNKDVQKKRAMIQQLLKGFWASCVEADPISEAPFVADVIIANPPSFAHLHCAQAAGIPLHMVFTMPWTSTRAFPHPLANLSHDANMPRGTANLLSYRAVEWLTWQGLQDIFNDFRESLDLERIPSSAGPTIIDDLGIPFTYCWSPSIIPKPSDWGPHIDVSGFIFREPALYTPPKEIEDFLSAGPPPIYIGFGSIVNKDSATLFATIEAALKETGVRAIVSRGWSNMDGQANENLLFIGDCPHEWLFQQVSAVMHHGGAGTTACALRYGRPTMVVPFFGDQQFWGQMVADAGAGPRPVHHSKLTVQIVADGIRKLLSPDTQAAAKLLSAKIQLEPGVDTCVSLIEGRITQADISCDVLPNRPAAWTCRVGKKRIKLSAAAADILQQNGAVSVKDLKFHQVSRYAIESRRVEPVTGATAALIRTVIALLLALYKLFADPIMLCVNASKHHDDTADETQVELHDLEAQTASPTQTQPPHHSVAYLAAYPLYALFKFYAMFALYCIRGGLVDIPFAIAEGMRGIPRLWGEELVDYGHIYDWKQGFSFAGKFFADVWRDMFVGLVSYPRVGLHHGSYPGAFLGFLIAIVAFVTKPTAACFGLYAYPAKGISRSVIRAAHRATVKRLRTLRLVQGSYQNSSGDVTERERVAAVETFVKLRGQ